MAVNGQAFKLVYGTPPDTDDTFGEPFGKTKAYGVVWDRKLPAMMLQPDTALIFGYTPAKDGNLTAESAGHASKGALLDWEVFVMMERQRSWYKQGAPLLNELSGTCFPEQIACLWYLGQSGFGLKTKELLVFFDPVFTDLQNGDGSTRRYYPAPFSPEQAAQAGVSYVFCSHDHLDHLQPETIVPMAAARPELKVIVPAPSVQRVLKMGVLETQVIAARAECSINLPDGCVCIPIPAAHEQYEQDENGDYRALSYIFRTASGIKLYHAGDTIVTPALAERLQKENGFDVVLLPINGADFKRRSRGIVGNMNGREAADLAADIHADLVIPCHYDMVFQNGEDPLHFAEYMQVYYPGRKFHILSLGERFLLTAHRTQGRFSQ